MWITEIAWAPDSRQLAYTLSYEGDSLSVLDTAVASTVGSAVASAVGSTAVTSPAPDRYTFVIAFARRPLISPAAAAKALPPSARISI